MVRSDKNFQTLVANIQDYVFQPVRYLAELKKDLQDLHRLRTYAYVDSLTGLKNRRYLDSRLVEELHRMQRLEREKYLSIILIDVDDLKKVNDEYGHVEGDRVLKKAAKFLEHETRQHDVCCRYGGDEFVIILPGTDKEGALKFIERMKEDLNKQTPKGVIKLSMGGATWPLDAPDEEGLLKMADLAMYRDKNSVRKKASERYALR